MKIVHIERLIDTGEVSSTPEWLKVKQDVIEAIDTIQWPANSGSFTLYSGKKANGVVPIKKGCMEYLKSEGWMLEYRLKEIDTGKIDAAFHSNIGLFGFEWETGNVSSSHRAVNKIALALYKEVIIGGIHVVPSKAMYDYITDRIGNFPELQPYFPLWRSFKVSITKGVFDMIVVEQDAVSYSVPPIPKGNDGNAKKNTGKIKKS